MASEWHRGVLTSSSWHGLEEVGVMGDAISMISAGETSGAWPVCLSREELVTKSGLKAPGSGVVGHYADQSEKCLSVVGGRYRATTPEEWRSLVHAAVAAGAEPTGAFSLRDGTRALATFQVGSANGLRTQLLICDSFDGSMSLMCGMTSIRVVCSNTLAAAKRVDGEGLAGLRHTASLEEKIQSLEASIGVAIATGATLRETYYRAEDTRLSASAARDIFDQLFPAAPEGSSSRMTTMRDAAREEAKAAMALPINNVGDSLATLWNAATYLVDRTGDGSARHVRAGDALDSLLFGARSQRLQEIQTIIEVIMADGSIRSMPASEALAIGANPKTIGAKLLEDMLEAV